MLSSERNRARRRGYAAARGFPLNKVGCPYSNRALALVWVNAREKRHRDDLARMLRALDAEKRRIGYIATDGIERGVAGETYTVTCSIPEGREIVRTIVNEADIQHWLLTNVTVEGRAVDFSVMCLCDGQPFHGLAIGCRDVKASPTIARDVGIWLAALGKSHGHATGDVLHVAAEKPPAALHKQAMSRGTCLHGGLPLDVVDGVSPLLSRISPVV